MRKEVIEGVFQAKAAHFGFVIPDERESWGGDFFVKKENFNGAKDGDRVEARALEKYDGKKPEAKILQIITGKKFANPKKTEKEVLKVIEGIYSGGDGNFGFIDTEWQESGVFVYGRKKNGAKDGDKVRAEVKDYNGKEEAIIIEIISEETEVLMGVYKDNDRFGFVLPDDKSGDIFIAWSRKGEAKDGDKVEVKIIKRWGKNPEGLIVNIV